MIFLLIREDIFCGKSEENGGIVPYMGVVFNKEVLK